MIHIQITQHQLSWLAKDAPTLRKKHLLDLQKAAEEKGDLACSAVILKILTCVQERKNSAISSTQPAHQEEEPPSRCKYKPDNRLTSIQRSTRCSSTPQTIYLNGSTLLTQLHITEENFRKDLGFMGDTKCAQKILKVYILTDVRNWNCNDDYNGRLPKLLAMSGWKDFVFFQRCHFLSL